MVCFILISTYFANKSLTFLLILFLRTEHSRVVANDGLSNLYLGDSWFASLTMAQGLAQSGHEVIGQLKTNHGGYPKDYLAEHLKDAPGGVHIVMKGTLPSGMEMVATGYKYSSKKVLFFISTPGAGPTTPGEPYEMRYTDG